MNKLKIAIVDDEPFARKKIANFLRDVHDIDIAAEYENGREALQNLPDVQPDVVFLDIQMPELYGFEV
ncbi:MAG: response regulator, partial [Calditrichaeota bacterium]